jgi:hypothetical protein
MNRPTVRIAIRPLWWNSSAHRHDKNDIESENVASPVVSCERRYIQAKEMMENRMPHANPPPMTASSDPPNACKNMTRDSDSPAMTEAVTVSDSLKLSRAQNRMIAKSLSSWHSASINVPSFLSEGWSESMNHRCWPTVSVATRIQPSRNEVCQLQSYGRISWIKMPNSAVPSVTPGRDRLMICRNERLKM